MGFIIVQPPFSYFKGFSLKKLLRTETPFDYIISFIRHNMKMAQRLPPFGDLFMIRAGYDNI